MTRIASGGGPTQRIPAAMHRLGEIGVLGQEPETGVERVGAGGTSRSDDRAGMSSRSSAPSPSVAGTTARMPSRSHVRVMRVAISPRLAMNRVRMGAVGAAPTAAPAPGRHQRVNRVTCDTPTPTNASRRQPAARDPALHGARRRTDPCGSLAGTQFLGHRCRDRRISARRAVGRTY